METSRSSISVCQPRKAGKGSIALDTVQTDRPVEKLLILNNQLSFWSEDQTNDSWLIVVKNKLFLY